MFSSYKHRQARQSAFTVVEMLVVVVVVALLATIGFLGYNGWRDDVASTEVMSDLTSLQSSMDNAKNWSQGEDSGYPALGSWTQFDGSNQTKDLLIPSPGVQVMYARGDNNSYCLEAFSKNRDNIHYYLDSSEGAVKKGTCSGGQNATPPPTSPSYTVFMVDTTAPGCSGTVQLPISSPASDTSSQINWGNGVTEVRLAARPSHTYAKPGSYLVSYRGALTQAIGTSVAAANKPCLIGVLQWANNIDLSKISRLGGSNMRYVAEPPKTVTDMSGLFYGASTFNQPIDHWDVSHVTNMDSMFMNATEFNQPLNNWDVSSATNMYRMFYSAKAFNQPLSSWTPTKATNMGGMFGYASAFNQNISGWNVNTATSWTGFSTGSALTTANTPAKFR